MLLSDCGPDLSPRVTLPGTPLPPTEDGGSVPGKAPSNETGFPSPVRQIFRDLECQIIGATVAEDVAFGPENLGLPPEEIRARVQDALQAVALDGLQDRAVGSLSGSQKLRLALAGALALQPECLLVQQATAALDRAGRAEATALLRSLSRDRGITVIQVSDDPEEAADADRVVVLQEGVIALDGTPDRVLPGVPEAAHRAAGLPEAPPQVAGQSAAGAGVSRFQEMTALHYAPGESILHRSDPRTKIILTLALMGSLFFLHSLAAQLLLLAILLALAAAAGKPLSSSFRGLGPVLWLAGVAVAVKLLCVPGTPVLDHGLLRHVSREAVAGSAALLLRVVLLASAASLLTLTTTPCALAGGVERLLKPLKRIGVPNAEISMMFLLALRFLPWILEEARQLIQSRPELQGPGKGGLAGRARTCLSLLIPLFARVLRRGDALAAALEARCYRGGAGRTSMRPSRFSGADLAVATTLVLILSLAAGLEHLWTGRQSTPLLAYLAVSGVK